MEIETIIRVNLPFKICTAIIGNNKSYFVMYMYCKCMHDFTERS